MKIYSSVAARVDPTADLVSLLIGTKRNIGTCAGKCCSLSNGAAVQSHCRSHHLEYGAGVVGIGYSLVSPLGHHSRIIGCILFLLRQSFDLCQAVLVDNGKGVIWVKVAADGKAYDRACVNLHKDGHSAVFNFVSFTAGIKVFLHNALNCFVNGKDQIVAILSRNQLLILERHICAQGIFSAYHTSGSTGEFLLIVEFKACKSGVVGSCKSKNSGCCSTVRIVALIVLNKADNAVDVVLIKEENDFVLYLGFNFTLKVGEVGFLIHLIHNLVIVHLENFGEACGDFNFILFIYVVRLKDHCPHTGGLGKNLSAGSVVNSTAVC